MHTRFSPEDLEFRARVGSFLDEQFTPELKSRVETPASYRDAAKAWHKTLFEQGWAAPGWPEEHGGTGWTDTQRFIFDSERTRRGAPEGNVFGLRMVGPVIYTFGSPDQKNHFLPRTLNGDIWWCQGYSEPGSGSDLASLRTRAVRDGDDYIVNGAKIWTTNAHLADWIFCLVRTNPDAPRKQEGISFLLIDMTSPGISVSPIISIDGRHSLNQVTFDDVRVPVSNCVGDENKGWTYAKALLAHERTATAGTAESKRALERVKALAATELSDGEPMLADADFQRRIAEIEIEIMALEYTEFRVLSTIARGSAPGAESSFLKIKGTEVQQAVQTLMMDLAGAYGGVIGTDIPSEALSHDFGDAARVSYMYGRASTIYSGSNEVQRNVIAKAVLGL